MDKPDPDIAALTYTQDPKVLLQLKIALGVCAIASFAGLMLWGAPLLFSLAIGGFFLLPLTGIKMIRQQSKLALEAHEKGKCVEVSAVWSGYSWSDSVTWTGDLDLAEGGKWRIKINGGTKGRKAFRKMKMEGDTTDVTAWLHPVTGEPRMIRLKGEAMSVDDVTEVMSKLKTES